MARTSEPAVNALLGAALRQMHPRWGAHVIVESTRVFRDHGAKKPDILICPPGAQAVVLETEFEPASTVEKDAVDRLGQVPVNRNEPIEHVVAVRMPDTFRRAILPLDAEINYCVYTDLDPYDLVQRSERWPRTGWLKGTLSDLADCVETLMVSQRLIDESLKLLEEGVRVGTGLMQQATELGFVKMEQGFGQMLQQEPGPQTTRMALVIIANALAFHDTIAATFGLPSVSEIRHDDKVAKLYALLRAWDHIMHEINYWPIFQAAYKLVLQLNNQWGVPLIHALADATEQLAAMGITTRHDVVGKMFQSLIVDRKFLATFYTRPTSAALLSGLATDKLSRDWNDLDEYNKLRVADLSCGTGTLLSAAYRAILMRYRRAGGDDQLLHSQMMEQAIIAADIMPAAAHLCASQLSSFHPTVTFGHTQVFTMPYGQVEGERHAVGSLDLINADHLAALFATGPDVVHGSNGAAESRITLPEHAVDLVIMNPPFTRPTNHKLTDVPVPSFAGFDTSAKEQRAMSARLKALRKTLSSPMGDGNAGLASYFLDLAHVKVKVGGIIAFVIPKTILKGGAWGKARAVLREHYRRIVVVSIASTGKNRLSFSADTDMAEVLLVAERNSDPRQASGDVLYVNLFSQPQTVLEAMEIARACRRIDSCAPYGLLKAGEGVLASFTRSTIDDGGCAAVRNVQLAQINRRLALGKLSLPRAKEDYRLGTVRLDKLGERGLVHRDIYGSKEKAPPFRGPFLLESADTTSSFPVLWSHDAERERSMVVFPDSQGCVRPGCEKEARQVWATATRLHLRTDLGLSAESVAACLTNDNSLGGRSWPNFACSDRAWDEVVALWFNSTLGLMSYWWHGSRQHHGRAILTITTLPGLTCVDPRTLRSDQIKRAHDIFEEFRLQEFLPANEAYRDAGRQALDRALLVDVLELPSGCLPALDQVRLQWCSEPTVHGGKRTAPAVRASDVAN